MGRAEGENGVDRAVDVVGHGEHLASDDAPHRMRDDEDGLREGQMGIEADSRFLVD